MWRQGFRQAAKGLFEMLGMRMQLVNIVRMVVDDPSAGHVPESWVYGPVHSRRFGNSLGISFSRAGQWACGWRCPYCQLGHLPKPVEAEPAVFAEVPELLAELDHALSTATALDVITIAGSGEPTDHPRCAELFAAIVERAHRSGTRVTLLTNGDGLGHSCQVADLDGMTVFVKWDPGPRQGAWRRLAAEDRFARFATLPALQVQTLVFDGPGGGNSSDDLRRRWQDDIRRLAPRAVQVTTIERPPPSARLRPLSAEALQAWAAAAAAALELPVRVFV